jgi:hypothetical protein
MLTAFALVGAVLIALTLAISCTLGWLLNPMAARGR